MEGKWSYYRYYLLDFSQQSKSFMVAVLPFFHPSLLCLMVAFSLSRFCLKKKKKVWNSISLFTNIGLWSRKTDKCIPGRTNLSTGQKCFKITCCFSGCCSLFLILNLSLLLFWDESVLYLFHAITNFVFFFLITVTCIRAPHLSLARPLFFSPFLNPTPSLCFAPGHFTRRGRC